MFGKFLKKIVTLFSSSSTEKKDRKVERAVNEKIQSLEKFLGFQINDREYFVRALTHRSFLEIAPQLNKSNERLEFLGDSVLSLVVSDHLFNTFTDKEEGFLTKYRSLMVNKEALAKAAKAMGLKDLILYDGRFVSGSSQGIKTILADALEALIGAVYLDQGIDTARFLVYKWIIEPNTLDGELPADKNYKGKLLELAHSLRMGSPIYKVIREEGPEHNKKFTVGAVIGGKEYGIGEGKSKKSAEQAAAFKAYDKLNGLTP